MLPNVTGLSEMAELGGTLQSTVQKVKSKQLAKANTQFTLIQNGKIWVWLLKPSMTLTIGQGNQNWYEHVKFNRGYEHADFQEYCLYGIRENANGTYFRQTRKHQLSSLDACLGLKKRRKQHSVHYCFHWIQIHTHTHIQNMFYL